jgi:hypothetical protein
MKGKPRDLFGKGQLTKRSVGGRRFGFLVFAGALVAGLIACGGSGSSVLPGDTAPDRDSETLDGIGADPLGTQDTGNDPGAGDEGTQQGDDTADITADTDPGEDANETTCEPNQALHGSICVTCAGLCTAPGETGVLEPKTTLSGRCVCQTRDGYYWEGASLSTSPCDADHDGWVAQAARSSIESSDPVIRTNARCQVRSIDRFVLVNQRGESLDVLLPGNLELYEPDRLDDEGLDSYRGAPDEGGVPLYGASKPPARALNPLTKYCAAGDFNGNGAPDALEWQTDPSLKDFPFTAFAYFAELHRGWYESVPGQPSGRYVIREKARVGQGEDDDPVPGLYDPTQEQGDVGPLLRCEVWPDPRYVSGDESSNNVGLDFARFSPYPGSLDFAHRVIDDATGLPLVIPTPKPGEVHFTGMNHHSQFRCVQIPVPMPFSPSPGQLAGYDFLDENGVLKFQMNTAGSSQTEHPPVTDPLVTPNPFDVSVPWSPVPTEELANPPANSIVGWAAVRYRPDSRPYRDDATYQGGCVNQCTASSYRCGLCGYGTWHNVDGTICGPENREPGPAGIPDHCEDIAHPAGVDLNLIACDGCDCQKGPCSTNMCLAADPTRCVPAGLRTGHACQDDGDPCTADVCADLDQRLRDCCAVEYECLPDDTFCLDYCERSTSICQYGGWYAQSCCTRLPDPAACLRDPAAHGCAECAHDVPAPATTRCGDGGQCSDLRCDGQFSCVVFPRTGIPCVLDTPNPCVNEVCSGDTGACGVAKSNGTPCSLDSPPPECHGDAQCAGGNCEYPPLPDNTPCADDGNPCTNDVCGQGTCTHPDKGLYTPCTEPSFPSTCTNSYCHTGTCYRRGECQPGASEYLQNKECNTCGTRDCNPDCTWQPCALETNPYNDIDHAETVPACDGGICSSDSFGGSKIAIVGHSVSDQDHHWYHFRMKDSGNLFTDPIIEVLFMGPVGTFDLIFRAVCSNDPGISREHFWTFFAAQTVPSIQRFELSQYGTDWKNCPEGWNDIYIMVELKSSIYGPVGCDPYYLDLRMEGNWHCCGTPCLSFTGCGPDNTCDPASCIRGL